MNLKLPVLLISISFILLNSCQKESSIENPNNSSLASLTTLPATLITTNTAISGGNITSDGGASVTARGVCWGTTVNPVISGSHTTDGTGTGTFVSNITGLNAGTVYYVRAYATNIDGTAYGNQVTFTTTTTTASLPTVTTTAISTITVSGAVSGGNITADGGATVTHRGVCWSTTVNPVISGSHTTDGTGTGSFVSNLTGLTSTTTYYVRAYATNIAGTAYGNQLSFTTATNPTGTDVYIGGFEKTLGGVKKAAVWKNGVATYQPDVLYGTGYRDAEVNSVFVVGSDVYAVGWQMSPVNPNKLAMLWKNAVPTILSDQSDDAEAKQVFVSGNDVYVVGWQENNFNILPRLWKNGVASQPFQVPVTGGGASSIFVSGTDLYFGGSVDNGTNSYAIPTTWKNGTATSLSNPYSAEVLSIFVSGTDVHAAGYSFTLPGNWQLSYWKNGVRTALGSIVSWDYNACVHVSGGNVFVSGDSYSGTRSIATYWKNGLMTQLNSGTDNYYAKGIFSYGADVYVVGQRESSPYTVAKLWKNGVETSLTNGSTDASASCVFIK
jgi:hypothetical protein